MKFLVLGAGLQGTACAWNLLQHQGVERVTLADASVDRLPRFLQAADRSRLGTQRLDARDHQAMLGLMREHRSVLCALPYYFNEPMTRLALEAGCHFADLGGNTEIVFQQLKLDDAAQAAGVSVVPDCGLAPGMVNILAAEGMRRVEAPESVRVFVGGLPQHPEPPLNYQVVYSLEGALDYYTTPSWVLREGRAVQVDALSEVETLDFPAPVGRLEAFHTGGGISTLPFKWEGRVTTMEYKTLRYPGHAAIMRPIRELGLISNEPVDVKGQPIAPRDLFIAAVRPMLYRPDSRDLVALRVRVTGRAGGRPAEAGFDLIDRYDEEHGIGAMMRTTGYSLALTGLMQADGTIEARGVKTPDEAVPFGPYVEGLGRFGIRIQE